MNVIKLLLALIAVLLLVSCDRDLTPSSSVTKDSVKVIERHIPVLLPGKTVTKEVNMDSLQKAFAAGQSPRYVYLQDKKGLTELKTRIDLLTGELLQECSTKDSLLTVMEKEIHSIKSQESVIVQQAPAAKKKGFLAAIDDFISALGYVALGAVVMFLGMQIVPRLVRV